MSDNPVTDPVAEAMATLHAALTAKAMEAGIQNPDTFTRTVSYMRGVADLYAKWTKDAPAEAPKTERKPRKLKVVA